MKRYFKAFLAISATLLPLFGYVYAKGREDGVAAYKQSRSFQLTLDSMYRFGLLDGRRDCAGERHAHH